MCPNRIGTLTGVGCRVAEAETMPITGTDRLSAYSAVVIVQRNGNRRRRERCLITTKKELAPQTTFSTDSTFWSLEGIAPREQHGHVSSRDETQRSRGAAVRSPNSVSSGSPLAVFPLDSWRMDQRRRPRRRFENPRVDCDSSYVIKAQ